VARAKDQIKRFRRRPGGSASTGSVRPALGQEDLPPPYSENPPLNPFYSEPPEHHSDTDHCSALDDSRPLVVSPPSQPALHQHPDPLYQATHLYPLLHPIVPPYRPSQPSPPPFSQLVTPTAHPFLGPGPYREERLRREDSYLSDGEAAEAEAAAGLGRLDLRPHPR
jgi:hypothetical protein